ncbi:hypothetical protein PF002_g32394, partial [Phytophthora fragariae]
SRATAQVAHVTSEHQDKGRKRSKQQRKRNKGVQDKKALRIVAIAVEMVIGGSNALRPPASR